MINTRLVHPDADIAIGVAGMCVNERGRLLEHTHCSTGRCAVRCLPTWRALGALILEGDDPSIGSPPGGFSPLDAAAEALAHGTSLDDWIRTGPLRVRDVVGALVAAGAWREYRRGLTHRLRYDTKRPKDRWGRTPERRLLQPLVGLPGDPTMAAVLLLTWAAGLEYQYQPVDDLLARTNALQWVCQVAWDGISDEREERRRVATAARMGKMVGPR